MAGRITCSEHTRRQFLRAAVSAGVGIAGAMALGGRPGLAAALGDADVFETRLDAYAGRVTRYTTPWGQEVDDWYPAFLAAHADLAAAGGGRLLVPGGDAGAERTYHVSAPVVFDLRSVSVHLHAGAYVERVGAPDVWRGAPLCFHGYLHPNPSLRRQQDFAALLGPGRVGYPRAQLGRYPHENGVGISFYKTVVVDGVQVPYAPGKGLTAQYGCNSVTFRNNRVGPTSQSAVEQAWPGQAALTVSGGWNPPGYPLFTDAVITGNVVDVAVRGVYVEFCERVELGGNQFAPVARTGLTVGACGRAAIHDNRLAQVSRGAHGGYDALEVVGVDDPDVLRNTVLDRTHRHCVRSAVRQGHGGVIHARDNHWTRGHGAIFAGSPPWDSD